jgi:hypothetical protein
MPIRVCEGVQRTRKLHAICVDRVPTIRRLVGRDLLLSYDVNDDHVVRLVMKYLPEPFAFGFPTTGRSRKTRAG